MKKLLVLMLLSIPCFAQKVVLNWSATAAACGPNTAYSIYRANATGMEDFTTPLGTVPAPTTTYTDATVQYGHTYFYKVKSMNGTVCGNGVSGPSNEASAVVPTQVIITQPPPPVQTAPQVIIP